MTFDEVLKLVLIDPVPDRAAASLEQVSDRALFEALFWRAVRAQSAETGVAPAAYCLYRAAPQCSLSAEEAVLAMLPAWDISIGEVPFYLAGAFTGSELMSALEGLEQHVGQSSGESAESARLRTVRYWLDVEAERRRRSVETRTRLGLTASRRVLFATLRGLVENTDGAWLKGHGLVRATLGRQLLGYLSSIDHLVMAVDPLRVESLQRGFGPMEVREFGPGSWLAELPQTILDEPALLQQLWRGALKIAEGNGCG